MRIPPKLARVRIFFFPLYLCHSFVRNPTTKTYICPLTTQDVSMLFFVVVGTRCKKFPGESSPLLFFFLKCHFDLFGDAQGPCDIKAKKEETKQQQKKKKNVCAFHALNSCRFSCVDSIPSCSCGQVKNVEEICVSIDMPMALVAKGQKLKTKQLYARQ